LRQRLAELLTFDLGGDRAHVATILDRRERFGVERFLVGDPTGEEDVDHGVGLGHDRRIGLQIGPSLDPQDIGQGETTQPNRANRQETSAAHRVTETIACHRHDSCVRLFRGLAHKPDTAGSAPVAIREFVVFRPISLFERNSVLCFAVLER
jgi:hypothetical protein